MEAHSAEIDEINQDEAQTSHQFQVDLVNI
jgi:hypothetical protein